MPKTAHSAPHEVLVAMTNLSIRPVRYEKFNTQGSLFWPRSLRSLRTIQEATYVGRRTQRSLLLAMLRSRCRRRRIVSKPRIESSRTRAETEGKQYVDLHARLAPGALSRAGESGRNSYPSHGSSRTFNSRFLAVGEGEGRMGQGS